MKICFVGWADHVHLERWANYFANAGHQVTVISVSQIGQYRQNVRTFSLAKIGRFSVRLQRLMLWGILNIVRPDIVHVHWAPFALLLNGLWKGPLVITVWGSDIYLAKPTSLGYPRLAAALRRANLVTADSADLCRRTEQLAGLPAGEVKEVQWGVDTGLFTPFPESGSNIVGRRSSSQVILSPRAFVALYNLDIIIRAFALVKRQRPDSELILKRYSQDPGYSTTIESLVQDLDLTNSVSIVERIHYEDMPDFYRSGSIVISIPDSDGTPMSVLEAMASGCVPIVSDLPSLRQWIRHGETGFLVNPKSAEEIAEAVMRILADRVFLEAAAEKNRNLIIKKASQSAHMSIMEEYYDNLESQ